MGFIGDLTNTLSQAAGVMTPLGAIAGGVSALGSLFGSSPEDKAMALAEKQHQWDVEENQKNRDFQSAEWSRQFNAINAYNDPSATKERMNKAGLNASALLNGQGSAIGQSSGSPSAPSGASGLNPMPDVVSQVGFQSRESLFRRLETLGNLSKNAYLLPETKEKLSAEIKDILADEKYKNIRADSEEFILSIDKLFKPGERTLGIVKSLKDLALADADIRLKGSQATEADRNAARAAAEKLLAEAKKKLTDKEFEKLEKELGWYDKVQEQGINESKSRENANNASAEESRTQADVNRQEKRIKEVVADVKESGKTQEIDTLIRELQARGDIADADANEAILRLNRINQIQDKRSGYWFKEVDGFTEWLKSKVKIFK